MTDEQITYSLQIHSNLPQEGPGSTESTLRALSLIPSLASSPDILDIGCGPGRQTIDLVKATKGNVTALDYFDQYLSQLKESAQQKGYSNSINCVQGSMDNLPFSPNIFDLIWSEGAIYLMGFSEGLKHWRQFLKHEGYIAVTEAVWLQDNPPKPLKAFWDEGYPEMKSIDGNLPLIKNAGYKVIDYFPLPAGDWWQYYNPLKERVSQLKQSGSDELQPYLQSEEYEVELYEQFSSYYGYAFYVMQKTD